MANFGIVNEPNTITLGPLIDAYLIYAAPVLFGTVLEPLETGGESTSDILAVGQLYPR